jgi:hypothetical protein
MRFPQGRDRWEATWDRPACQLHRSGLLFVPLSGLIAAIDLLLDIPVLARGGANVQAVLLARSRPCKRPLGQRDRSCAPALARPQPRRADRMQVCGHLPLAELPWGRREFGSARPGAKPLLPALPDSWRRSEDAADGQCCQVALTRRRPESPHSLPRLADAATEPIVLRLRRPTCLDPRHPWPQSEDVVR